MRSSDYGDLIVDLNNKISTLQVYLLNWADAMLHLWMIVFILSVVILALVVYQILQNRRIQVLEMFLQCNARDNRALARKVRSLVPAAQLVSSRLTVEKVAPFPRSIAARR